MPHFLILRLDGPMQAWGTHTFEDFRPTNIFPTRSALLGLLGACLGIERNDTLTQERLAASVTFTVRADQSVLRVATQEPVPKRAVKLPDFHTVMDARKVDGSPREFPIVSRREYLFDAAFSVAVGIQPGATFTMAQITEALRHPCYTPTLGRRACPIARPLLDNELEAVDAKAALSTALPAGGLIYAEADLPSDQPLRIRDVPMHGRKRQFASRLAYLHKEPPCS